MAALQKVLQSDFLQTVREVYEHVYETVDVSGTREARANATAKVCINLFEEDPKKPLIYLVLIHSLHQFFLSLL